MSEIGRINIKKLGLEGTQKKGWDTNKMKGKNVTFAHFKGGTGKTTSCLNIAGYLHQDGKKVLVIDFDPQGNATSGLGIDKNSLDCSMYDVITGEKDIREIIVETESGIHLAPANLDLMKAESYLYGAKSREFVLRGALRGLSEYYDYVLIDTPPGPGLFIINGIVASDIVFVPLDPGIFALEGVEDLNAVFNALNDVVSFEVKRSIGILTRCMKPSLFSKIMRKNNPVKEIKAEAENFFEKVFLVPFSEEVYSSQLKGLPLSSYASRCDAGKAYKEIVEVLDNGK